MAKQENKKSTTKVKAECGLARVGLAYFEGDEFEIDSKVAAELIEDGLVRRCGK